jgi:hypothetical protein
MFSKKMNNFERLWGVFDRIINKIIIFVNKNAFFFKEHLLSSINTLYLYVCKKIIFTNPKNFLL